MHGTIRNLANEHIHVQRLHGAEKAIAHCKDIFVESQHQDYNIGAPKFDQVKQFLESKGFESRAVINRTEVDADYHFFKVL